VGRLTLVLMGTMAGLAGVIQVGAGGIVDANPATAAKNHLN